MILICFSVLNNKKWRNEIIVHYVIFIINLFRFIQLMNIDIQWWLLVQYVKLSTQYAVWGDNWELFMMKYDVVWY